MTRPARQFAVGRRIDLSAGDVCALEVHEDGERLRLTVHDDAGSAIPLIAAWLTRNERRRLVAALTAVDIVRRRRA